MQDNKNKLSIKGTLSIIYAGIMVSDFIEEHDGYLRLSQEELKKARESNPDFPQEARELFEYGVSRDGYWTSEKFMKQIEDAFNIVNTIQLCIQLSGSLSKVAAIEPIPLMP